MVKRLYAAGVHVSRWGVYVSRLLCPVPEPVFLTPYDVAASKLWLVRVRIVPALKEGATGKVVKRCDTGLWAVWPFGGIVHWVNRPSLGLRREGAAVERS